MTTLLILGLSDYPTAVQLEAFRPSDFRRHPMQFRPAAALCVFATTVAACANANVDWPVYQGNDEKTHYTTLSQISPANVSTLKVAWTYDTGDAFEGSEMQSNPVIIDGVLYAMSRS